MDINQQKFHQALLEYFEKLHAEVGRSGWNAESVEKITMHLRELVEVERTGKTPKEIRVNIHHNVGPFGIRIEYYTKE